MTAIRGIQLGKTYRHYQVFSEVSFEVSAGECFVLLGPNGAGKTTLLKILATLHRPTSGRFEVMGVDGVREKETVRQFTHLVSHGTYLYQDLNGIENLRFSMALRKQRPTEKAMKVALDRVGIGAFAQYKVSCFSEGMKKRLSLARVMLIAPKVLLLDEPYAALDEAGMVMVNRHLRDCLRDGMAILMTSHHRTLAAEVATRGAVLKAGQLREISTQEIASDHELF